MNHNNTNRYPEESSASKVRGVTRPSNTGPRWFIATWLVALIVPWLASDTYAQSKPNIILINLDDADAEMFEMGISNYWYPNIMGVAEAGITFDNLHVTTPLCGPSRACLYRGQYAHNTGICVNEPGHSDAHNFNGGFRFYREQGYFEDDLGIWMQDAGYRTMLVGKFLHHDFEEYVPPGWDDFYSYLGARYYDTWLFTNEHLASGMMSQLAPGLYRTRAETEDVVHLLQLHAERNNQQPFFLNVNPLGPHIAAPDSQGMVETNKLNWWTKMLQPMSPSYDELDFSDKRGHFRGLPRMPAWGHLFARTHYRDRALATRSCDDMVGEIRKTLQTLGLEDNTYIFITSDNGFSLGHHRALGKGTPTDRNTRVPFFVMGPGIPAGRKAHHLLAHIDLAPTFVSLANGTVPEFVDGRSFSHLLTPNGIDLEPSFRKALLVENWFSLTEFQTTTFTASTTLRTTDEIYTEWANGDKDFYDLKTDPGQVNNTYDSLGTADKEFYYGWLRMLKNPNRLPNARFSNPQIHNQLVAPGISLRGLAEDSQGVHVVRLAIFDVNSRRFWDGNAWQDTFKQVLPELENPDGQITFWNYSAMPTGDDVGSGQINVWAWAFDDRNNYGPPTRASIQLE